MNETVPNLAAAALAALAGVGLFLIGRWAVAAMKRRSAPRVSEGGTGRQAVEEARGILPRLGERPVFGRHRLPRRDAESAAAWPSLETLQRRRERKWELERRFARGELSEAEMLLERRRVDDGVADDPAQDVAHRYGRR